MIDFSLFYKTKHHPDHTWHENYSWDIFLSAYNINERVQFVFDRVNAKKKYWIIHPEYGFSVTECPTNHPVFTAKSSDEALCINELFNELNVSLTEISLCVDITGLMRPHIMFLIRYLAELGVRKLDVLYSEPAQYVSREKTTFAKGRVTSVRQVAGYAGHHVPSSGLNDLLIIASGYEHELIKHVADSKEDARKIQIFGFPSLQADFYQENVLRAAKAAEAIGVYAEEPVFAPANDPFVTASILRDLIDRERIKRKAENVYLSPLATKPQALGFALYYLYDAKDQSVSIIYPFTNQYERDTAVGISKIWRYCVELPTGPSTS